MSRIRTSSLLLGILVLTPALAMALPQGSTTPPAKTTAKPAPAATVHATSGKVKSVDATSLVISRSTSPAKDMTFVVNASTEKKGTLAAGAEVQVRYKTEGKENIATAVTVQTKK